MAETPEDVVVATPKPKQGLFHHFRWFDENDTPEERKLIWKLDLLIVPYALLVYWVKYLDAANLNNAYVSGMKEDLNLGGNDLSHLQSALLIGNCIGQVPGAYFFPKVPLHILIPALGLGWGIFNLLQYRAKGLPELIAYRFLIGLFEASRNDASPFFIAVHYTLGSWYKGHELDRRGSCFYIGLALGTLTASLLQAAATKNLDGVNGLEGWRWNFIITSVCTLPLTFVGWFIFPSTPDKPNRFSINKRDIEIAKKRLESSGHRPPADWTWKLVKKVFSTWHIYVLVFWNIMFWNGSLNTANGGYLLWIKSLKRYSIPEVNNLGATMPAIGIFITLAVCFGADFFRSPAWAITLAYIVNILGLVIIIIWEVPEPSLWFAFNTTYFANAISSVLYGGSTQLGTEHTSALPEQRAFTRVMMNAICQSTTAWTLILTFPTVEAPRFTKEYSFVVACAIILIVMTRQHKELQESDDERSREVADLVEPTTIEVEPIKKI
ncbi:MFS transporter (Seo1) [Cadophora gregata]|uniref:MFS transporter (Seo1) n=1 Tax=Cadophora gregata TaxID=51156 RepID=UPI0026DA9394|nr:MFS transporter (Seo1) [Cadophora gregata]KAK0106931.1 MFS transporter (Seo1) [Cadophora gregata]